MNELIELCKNYYDIDLDGEIRFIDSSHGEEDIRYNYILNNSHVIKICNTAFIDENFLIGIEKLIGHYKEIGVWCPKLYRNKEGKLLTVLKNDDKIFKCYIEEFSPYSFSKNDKNIYKFKKSMLSHLGILAKKYSNVDLVKHYSMWSIIEKGIMCEKVDEKQENIDDLLIVLKEKGCIELANELDTINKKDRDYIKERYKDLPKCVFQGDLNPSNILVDENGAFTGIIDFNMYGTEVNVNCFLNESMYYLKEEDFKCSAKEIANKMLTVQKELIDTILKEYTLNTLEEEVYPYYKRIINLSFYPNVQLWIKMLKENIYVDIVIELIDRLIELY